MASNDRLTKRVKYLEDWVAENEDMGGPKGHLDTMVWLLNLVKGNQEQFNMLNQQFSELRSMTFAFMQEQKLETEWDEFVQEKQNALQEQQTEEVSVEEEAERGEETSEAPEEDKTE
jgi:peptidoglycan hydrolase CwlO-like protein